MNQVNNLCVVDDDQIYHFTFGKTLKSVGYSQTVLYFDNGEEALEYLKNYKDSSEELPDIIFLDINMPILDGWDFLEEYILIKPQLTKKITIYLVTSSVLQSDMDRAKKINEVSAYLIKPISKEELTVILNNLN